MNGKRVMDSHRAFKADLYEQFAGVGKALASPARLELLDLLGQGERSVEDLAFEADLSVANASQHLQILRQAGLVEVNRKGKFSYYRLAGKEAFKTWQSLRDFAAVSVAEVRRLAEQYLHKSGELETITIAELRRRLATGDVILIDVRPELEYRAGHIPGALCVPVEKLATFLRMLPRDKEIVAYCRGPFCFFSHKAVVSLTKKGFNARRLKSGLPDWRFAGLPVETDQSG
jgi:rhodanese-related sulfurtransferase/stalled ribosome alternative rescue factor ArfA